MAVLPLCSLVYISKSRLQKHTYLYLHLLYWLSRNLNLFVLCHEFQAWSSRASDRHRCLTNVIMKQNQVCSFSSYNNIEVVDGLGGKMAVVASPRSRMSQTAYLC